MSVQKPLRARSSVLIAAALAIVACAAPAAPGPRRSPVPAPTRAPAPPPAPAQARHGTLEEFTAALGHAIRRHDFVAIGAVMTDDFSSGFVGPSNPAIAFAAWRSDDFRSLDEAAKLLEGGLVETPEGVWVAPDAYRTTPGYRGLRTGIGRGEGGGWVWLFLVRGEG